MHIELLHYPGAMHLVAARRVGSILALASAFAALPACGGGNVQVKTNSANASSLARYHTYVHEAPAALAANGSAATSRTSELLEKARARVDAELQRRGYALLPAGKAEVIVRVTSTVRQVPDQPTGLAAVAGAPSGTDDVGFIVVDMLDEKTKETLFHGSASKEIHTNKVDDGEIGAAIAQLMEPIPASAGGAP